MQYESDELAALCPDLPWLASLPPSAAATSSPSSAFPKVGVTSTCSPPPGWFMQRELTAGVDSSGTGCDGEGLPPRAHSGPTASAAVLRCRPGPFSVGNRRGMGACLIASRDLAAGETVLIESSSLAAPLDAAVFHAADAFARRPQHQQQQQQSRVAAGGGSSASSSSLPPPPPHPTRHGRGVAAAAAFLNAVLAPSSGPTASWLAASGAAQWVAALVANVVVAAGAASTFASTTSTTTTLSTPTGARGSDAGSSSGAAHHHSSDVAEALSLLRPCSAESCPCRHMGRQWARTAAAASGEEGAADDGKSRPRAETTRHRHERQRALERGARLMLEPLRPAIRRITAMQRTAVVSNDVKTTTAATADAVVGSAPVPLATTLPGGIAAPFTPLEWAAAVLIRCGLADSPRALAAWLDAAACNALEARVPGLPDRVAVFPTLRLFEHECRPSCAVSFLDSPMSHGWLPHVAASHVQPSDPVYGPLIALAPDGARTGSQKETHQQRRTKPPQQPGPQQPPEYGVSGGDVAAGTTSSSSSSCSPLHILLRPAVAIVTTIRAVSAGEALSIAYLPTAWLPCAERRRDLYARYLFTCRCAWCAGDAPDVTRAFRCQRCERGSGAVCPRGDGSKIDLWECVQCGWRPDAATVAAMVDREARLLKVKADKASGLAKLINDEYVHYSHYAVLRKLDEWAEVAWRAQDAPLCLNILETLIKCADRVGVGEDDAMLLAMRGADTGGGGGSHDDDDPETTTTSKDGDGVSAAAAGMGLSAREKRRVVAGGGGSHADPDREQPDTTKAQYLEFLGQVHHALGNAHSARDAYRHAYLARSACGQRLSWWCRATRRMAEDRSLADLMDSK